MNKTVAVDCDGVLADFEGAFCEKFGWENRALPLEKRYPEMNDEIELFILASKTYEYLDIVPLGVRIIRYLANQGYEIHIVTSRPEYCTEVTGLWLKQNKIPFHFLSVGVTKKIGYYLNLFPSMVIEDSWHIAQGVAELGLNSLLINQPWNDKGNPERFQRISDFSGFLMSFEQYLNILI